MLKLFISYSHKDTDLKTRLQSHLNVLAREHDISIWTDLQINAGDEWDPAIMNNLESSQIIVLLLSVDFLNSKFCMARELESALDLHDSKRSLVIPIILHPIPAYNYVFNKIQTLPPPAPTGTNAGIRAMSAWDNFDVACVEVCKAMDTSILAARQGFLKDLNKCNIDFRYNEIEKAVTEGEILKGCHLLMDFCTDFSPKNVGFKIKAKSITGTFQSITKDKKDDVTQLTMLIEMIFKLLEDVRQEPVQIPDRTPVNNLNAVPV